MEGFSPVHKRLEELGIEAENAELQRIPTETKLLAPDDGVKVMKVIEMIEEDDDVQNVFHNMEVTDEIIEAMDN
ncbi:MAG: YebC/PmpR family DNA-binding transcriptional regulator [Bacteroidales bacterium]|nr:YebC/PmpR family DNA-binding transcriptional regulator [Bacteroidales bacterium]